MNLANTRLYINVFIEIPFSFDRLAMSRSTASLDSFLDDFEKVDIPLRRLQRRDLKDDTNPWAEEVPEGTLINIGEGDNAFSIAAAADDEIKEYIPLPRPSVFAPQEIQEEYEEEARDVARQQFIDKQVEQTQTKEHNTKDIEEALRQRSIALNQQGSMGNKVVFFDLEWHTLDKKQAKDVTDSESSKFYLQTSHICQMCAISSNYNIRFNQYVYYRQLAEPWRQLAEDWNVVEYSPQDDGRIAISLEDCLDQLLNTFEDHSLFLSYGSTDASAIFKYFAADGDYDEYNKKTEFSPDLIARRAGLRERFKKRQWRWGNIQRWNQKFAAEKLDLQDIKLAGSLGVLYDNVFHKPLWMSTAETIPEIVVPRPALELVSEKLTDFSEIRDRETFGLVPREWLEVKDNAARRKEGFKNCYPDFWPTQHLQPVFHVAHTDTIMTINAVAIMGLAMWFNQKCKESDRMLEADRKAQKTKPQFIRRHGVEDQKQIEKINKQWSEAERRDGDQWFGSLASAVISKTWFFRRNQLSLSESLAEDIYTWYDDFDEKIIRKKTVKTRRHKTTDDMLWQEELRACHYTGRPKPDREIFDAHPGESDLSEFQLVERAFYNKPYNGIGPDSTIWLPELPDIHKIGDIRYKVKWSNDTSDPTDEDGWDWWVTIDHDPAYAEAIAEFEEDDSHDNPVGSNALAREWYKKQEENKQKKQEKKTKTKGKPTDPEIAQVLNEIETNHKEEVAYEAKGKEPIDRYYLVFNTIDSIPVKELVHTKRGGKFTDKVHAIRDFLIRESEKPDPVLYQSLVRKEHRYSEKRKGRYPLDPIKAYTGLPWFSLPTSVVEPNTHMLHTMACRNLSDPRDRKQTRNWAELETMLWEFDLISKNRMFINTRFRFCKECKVFTSNRDPQSSGNVDTDAAVQRLLHPAPTPTPEAPATEADYSSHAHSTDNQSKASSVSSRYSDVTLAPLEPDSIPLTNIVGYFSLLSSALSTSPLSLRT